MAGAAGAVVAILVVVVGGPFVYIHFIEGKAPAPLHLTQQTTATTTGGAGTTATGSVTTVAGSAPATVDGTWNVDTGSTAGYRIKETLFGQSNTAVGRTSAIKGSIAIRGTAVATASFTVDLTTVSSDRSQRDSQFQHRIMDTSTYPDATFSLTEPIQLGTLPASGASVTEKSTGNLTLHGTTRSVTFSVSAQQTGSQIQVSGSIPITFADYNISNPSGGPATTEDHGTLEFLLNLTHG